MKNILRLMCILTIAACTKEKTNECDFEEKLFDYEVKVEDYYSKEPINGQIVVLRYCEGSRLSDFQLPCDSMESKTTSKDGIVGFSGSYLSGCGSGHELILLKGNGYPYSPLVEPEENILTASVRIKPIISTEFRLKSSLDIDSVRVWISAVGYGGNSLTFEFKDSINASIPTIPDQVNHLFITGFGHDTIAGHRNLEFTPEYGEVNTVYFEFK